MATPNETDQEKRRFADLVKEIETQPGYKRPTAFGIGLACLAYDGSVLDVRFPDINLGQNYGTAAVLRCLLNRELSQARVIRPNYPQLEMLLKPFGCFRDDPAGDHPNIDALKVVRDATMSPSLSSQRSLTGVIVFIDDLAQPPASAEEVWLRLHLLSNRLVQPHGVNLDGAFGLLTNVAWTSNGPMLVSDIPDARVRLMKEGGQLLVNSVDKFPRMTDYVAPASGVRITHADNVRLGAHLAEGTTVMHHGFVNFNAGTLGPCMIEGRISAGVVVGAGSDLGGGCSTMGTLSGGGTEVIRVGQRCLIGANAGIGISLGDDCIVEAGLYVTAGTVVTYYGSVRKAVKARELSGQSGLIFRRNSVSGAVEVLPNRKAVELNPMLHDDGHSM